MYPVEKSRFGAAYALAKIWAVLPKAANAVPGCQNAALFAFCVPQNMAASAKSCATIWPILAP